MGKAAHPPVPDWKSFTIGPNTPELVEHQTRLKAYGLKDPWIRNEAWRYDRNIWKGPTLEKSYPYKRMFLPGIKYGLALAIITASISKYYDYKTQGDHHH